MVVSLYRKYRPQIFDQVVGQEHIERTLRNAVADGTVSHAYLFCGPRGTGKTTTARLLAKALLCGNGPTADPCGTCEQCKDIAAGTHPDVYELDAASRTGVDNVREEIIGRVAFAPTRGRYKVYIIDEVHMLSTAAFNALLKTLEEPPEHVVFVLCTTDPHKVPETIISRCQRFDFHRISVVDIMANLRMICQKEGIDADEDALELIARHSSGGMRDAITSLEQLSVFSGGHIKASDAEGLMGEVESTQMMSVAKMVAERDVAGCFSWVATFSEGGTDVAQFSKELTAYFRDLYVMSITGDGDGISDVSPEEYEQMRGLVSVFGGSDRISRDLLILADLNAELRYSTDARLSLEIAFTRMARPDVDLTLESLAERVEALESGVQPMARIPSVVPGAPAAASPAAPAIASPAAPTAPAAPAAPTARPVAAAAPTSATPTSRFGATSAPAAPAVPTSRFGTAPAAAVPAAPMAHFGAAPAAPAASTPAAPAVDPGSANGGHPSSVVAPGELSNATATRLWAATMKVIQRRKPSLIGVLVNTHASVAPGGETLIVELPASNAFSKRMLEESDNNELIRSCIAETFGHVVPFRITTAGRGPEPAPLMPVEETPGTDLFGRAQAGADSTADAGMTSGETISMDIPAAEPASAPMRSVYASIPVATQAPKPLYSPPAPQAPAPKPAPARTAAPSTSGQGRATAPASPSYAAASLRQTSAPASAAPSGGPASKDGADEPMVTDEIPEVEGSMAALIFGAFSGAAKGPAADGSAAAGADASGSVPLDEDAAGASPEDIAEDDGMPAGSEAASAGGYSYDDDVPPLSDDEIDGLCDGNDEGED